MSTLKARLDGLRRAKNTTIIRREREEIRISSLHFDQHQSLQSSLCTMDSGRGSEATQCCHHDVLEQVKELEPQVSHWLAMILRTLTSMGEQSVKFQVHIGSAKRCPVWELSS